MARWRTHNNRARREARTWRQLRQLIRGLRGLQLSTYAASDRLLVDFQRDMLAQIVKAYALPSGLLSSGTTYFAPGNLLASQIARETVIEMLPAIRAQRDASPMTPAEEYEDWAHRTGWF